MIAVIFLSSLVLAVVIARILFFIVDNYMDVR